MTTQVISQNSIDFTLAPTEPQPAELQTTCSSETSVMSKEPQYFSAASAQVPRDQRFQNQYPIKLWGTCSPVSDLALSSESLELSDIPLNQSAALPSFDLRDADQSCMAQHLNVFLGELRFDEIHQRVHLGEYGKTPIYDTTHDAAKISRTLSSMKPYSAEEKNAFLFFMYGHGLTGAELSELFSDKPQLFAQMKAMNLIVAEPFNPIVENYSPDQIRYRLNDLSLTSQRLPNGETLYLFVDLPARLQAHPTGETSAQLSGTSYNLLRQLMKDYRGGKDYSGVAADFGAGTGIQALALLKMYPRIDTSISLEIDERSMSLNRLNALLNGVADRVQVIDNTNLQNLSLALAGRQLDLAVSNPPFNTLPHEYKGQLTSFGYGGDHGIDVTKIFLNQAMPLMKKNGEFIFYSVLAEDESSHYYVGKFLQESFRGLSVYFSDLDGVNFRFAKRVDYAKSLAEFIRDHGQANLNVNEVTTDIEAKLKERGVGQVSEKIVRIIPRADDGPTTLSPPVANDDRIKNLKLTYDGKSERPGGVFIETHMMGGERITRLSRLGGVFERLNKLERPGGGVFEVESEFRKTLESEALKKCGKDPECLDLMSAALKNLSEKKSSSK